MNLTGEEHATVEKTGVAQEELEEEVYQGNELENEEDLNDQINPGDEQQHQSEEDIIDEESESE